MTSLLALPSWIRRAAPQRTATPLVSDLLAGQRQAVDLAPGDTLRVAEGRVRVMLPPRWLGDALLQPSQTLGAGEVHRCVERGAVTLLAIEASRVQRAR
jgi:hypothetical protein